MDIRPIRNDDDLRAALQAVEALWSAEPGTEDGDKLEVLTILISAYEAEHYPIAEIDPISAIVQAMESKGLKQKDFADLIGSKSRASEIMRKRRALNIAQADLISRAWGIPAAVLIKPYHIERAA